MKFNGKKWAHEAKLVAANPVGPFPLMGSGVAISDDGNTVLSGAPLDNEAGNTAGAAHLFRKVEGKWTEIAKLTASDGGSGQDFAESLALNGDIALMKGGQNGSIKAYIFAGIQGIDCNHNGQPDACDIFDGQSVDKNGNGIPDECEPTKCPWDLDNNGSVGTSDLLELFAQWGTSGTADFDHNGIVNTVDLLTLFANWGPCPASGLPEPLTLEEELADACLTQANWDEYVGVMTGSANQATKDRYKCWMEHYLNDCNRCTCLGPVPCPAPDPFDD